MERVVTACLWTGGCTGAVCTPGCGLIWGRVVERQQAQFVAAAPSCGISGGTSRCREVPLLVPLPVTSALPGGMSQQMLFG